MGSRGYRSCGPQVCSSALLRLLVSEIIALRDLRNDVSAILRWVAAGESFTVTVRGEVVAELGPIRRLKHLVPHDELVVLLGGRAPDPDLADELRALRREGDGLDRAERLLGA